MSKTVGVVMIVKNEEAMLAQCLESVKDADEIVICDTGSTDHTLEIARQYTDNIYTDFIWCDDFAAARNHAKKNSTTDWILSMDADEFCHDFSKVREAVELAFMAVDCNLYAADNRQHHYFPRLFKNSPQVSWVGAIHNHLSVLGERVGDVRITYNYSPAHFQDRDRTMRILEKEVKRPDAVRERFYLGREYYYRQRYEDAVVILGLYVQQSKHLAEKAEAFLVMSRCYWEGLHDPDSARDAIAQCLIINPHFKEACLWMAKLAGIDSENPRWRGNGEQWARMAATASNNDVLFVRECEAPALPA